MQSAKICLLHSFPLVARRLSVLTQFLYYGSSRLVVKAAAAKKRNSHQNRTESHLRENSSSSQGEMRLQLKRRLMVVVKACVGTFKSYLYAMHSKSLILQQRERSDLRLFSKYF